VADVRCAVLRDGAPGRPTSPGRADEAVYFLALFLVLAALETTSTLLSILVWLLLEHPVQLERHRSQPQYIPGAVKEALRYDSPTRW
jgi:cytochrome P450